MLKAFKPTWMVENVFQISPQKLRQHGITTVLADLDNTLIPWNNKNSTTKLKHWMESLQAAGIKLVVVSNNNPKRVKRAVGDLQLSFVAHALKPLPVGMKRALKQGHLHKQEVVMVGDQLLTDVLAANNCKIKSIWVKPLVQTDLLPTKLNRQLEKLVYRLLQKKYKLQWKEDID
ncbi:YqeG family HAD IIIA-type phosphatase [Fructilactobacillus myrtifloralis]|uniref:YqeG family HAD IIIA-type phosphatase n=1 Tax=Fructilactobacillus myrtifloralis TaxID=2940301 RepID=A0ABY5BNT1_9LACO|nr:YqeG family HAD IIIA-type phosphatase [Fructilactobacillus myrtifloralis]USS85247.1 YqeG family HAD IIIA-type phosphatase [Fructilactobacillus myrtifloralis]